MCELLRHEILTSNYEQEYFQQRNYMVNTQFLSKQLADDGNTVFVEANCRR